MSISTHVLDTARGCPAAGLAVSLSRRGADGAWSVVEKAVTDGDGRVRELAPGHLRPGDYKLEFATAAYFKAAAMRGLYPEVSVVFNVTDSAANYHVPLLLSPYGYSTYKGT